MTEKIMGVYRFSLIAAITMATQKKMYLTI